MGTSIQQTAWWALESAASRARHLAAAALREHGLTPAQYELLELLEGMRCGCCGEGECRCASSYLCQNDVVGRIRCTKGNVSSLVQRLHVEGLISREPDPADRRHNAVRITARGRAALMAARPAFATSALETMEPMTDEETKTLTDLLLRLSGATSNATGNGSE